MKEEAVQLKQMVRSTEARYQKLLDEAKKETDVYRETADRLKLKVEESLLACNGKEMSFTASIKKAEEERTLAQQETARLAESLKAAKYKIRAAKEENNKLRDIMNHALNEATAKYKISPSVYVAHIQAHPAHEKFINKKIDMFEEMSLVCGNDRARGDCGSFDDISLDSCSEKGNNDDIQGPSKEKEVEDVVSETPQVKISRKRSRSDIQDMFVDVSSKLGEVASAISRIAGTKLDVKKLNKEVMSIEGYEEAFLSQAVDFLVEREPLARAFMEKSQALRKLWLDTNKKRIL